MIFFFYFLKNRDFRGSRSSCFGAFVSHPIYYGYQWQSLFEKGAWEHLKCSQIAYGPGLVKSENFIRGGFLKLNTPDTEWNWETKVSLEGSINPYP